ncbi:MAG TPA: PQQ-binding-like beta-propeller repeat protein [Candidatus Sulfotelmatobacter sp.]|nr:PQQ-binding-like beta-propeller repeat protein [Candidatus Sulfotelmatobacter sp.]
MLKSINMKTAVAISFILMLTVSILFALTIQTAKAQLASPISGTLQTGVTPDAIVPTKAFLSYRPNPVGLNQLFLINMWTTPAPGAGRWHPDYKLTITKPDGKQDVITMDSYVADGTAWLEYVADQVGIWKLKFDFAGTYFPAGNYSLTSGAYMAQTNYQRYTTSAYYQPDSTEEQTLTVQQDMVWSVQPVPLPTDYWVRPVQIENREWWPILGDYPWFGPAQASSMSEWDSRYPATNKYYNPRQYFVPWVQGPNSPHVVWKRQGEIGGLVGSGFAKENYIWPNVGDGNEPTIIFQGRCYEVNKKVMPTTVNGTVQNIAVDAWESYDLRTGELFWSQTGVPEPTAIEYGGGSMPVPGVVPKLPTTNTFLVYIGNGRLIKYSPFSGAIYTNVSIAPLTSATYYMNGFALGVQNLGTSVPAAQRYRLINFTTFETSTNFTSRIMNNVSWPFSSLPSTTDYGVGVAVQISGITEGGGYVGQTLVAASLTTGNVLWNASNDEPVYSGSSNVADNGKVAMLSAKGYYLGYDLLTGKLSWKSDTMDYPWDEPGWGTYGSASAYGMFYRDAYSGVYAFDWNTGKIVWKFESPALTPYESDFTDGNGTTVYPFNAPSLIADGKYFVYNAEHSPDSPNNRGWRTFAINITTGEKIWQIMLPGGGWFGGSSAELAVADGYLTVGGIDGYLYVFGKGKSATTVTAPEVAVPKGTSLVIKGTVFDISPGQPNTPAVSKESMSTQMEYLHKQLPIDGIWHNETITGVPVALTAIAADGSAVNLGTVTTDGYYGTFSKTWTPDKEGDYKIIASFAGDESYGSSSASDSLTVGPAPATTDTGQQPEITVPDYTLTLIVGFIAVIIAVAIAVLILRKK